jgi:hypothetical protein
MRKDNNIITLLMIKNMETTTKETTIKTMDMDIMIMTIKNGMEHPNDDANYLIVRI